MIEAIQPANQFDQFVQLWTILAVVVVFVVVLLGGDQ